MIVDTALHPPKQGSGIAMQTNIWDERYSEEGHLWGDEPSATALEVLQRLGPASAVLEVGFGYGRDLIELVKQGHRVTGVEESTVGLYETLRQLKEAGLHRNAHLTIGDFTTADLPQNKLDAVFSHRVLHLIGDKSLVRAFATRAAGALKPNGLLVIAARDERDFDPEQMTKLNDGSVTYKDEVRIGHLISLWNEARFKDTFEFQFHIEAFKEGEEIESKSNPDKLSKFTIMIARKRDLHLLPS